MTSAKAVRPAFQSIELDPIDARLEGPVGNIFVYLVSQHMAERLRSVAHGSVFSTITRETFDALSMVMPDETELTTFESTVAPLFNRIQANVLENRTLSQIRDLLLPKLMSGEILLREAEKMVEAAA